jgi:hypothetical protein
LLGCGTICIIIVLDRSFSGSPLEVLAACSAVSDETVKRLI